MVILLRDSAVDRKCGMKRASVVGGCGASVVGATEFVSTEFVNRASVVGVCGASVVGATESAG